MAGLRVDKVTKEYPTRAEPLTVLREVTFAIENGQSAAVLGPSGCGKSTLLQILGTLQPPTSGTIELDGMDPSGLGANGLADFRNKRIGFIFQDHHLLPQLSAIENVLVPAIAKGQPTSNEIQRANELLDRVGLAARKDHRPGELSGGERQRVSTARALINGPSLLLADEPTGNLDHNNADQVADLLKEVQAADEQKPIMIVVTHSQELAKRFDHQWHLLDGRLTT